MKFLFAAFLSLITIIEASSQKVSISPYINIRNENSYEIINVNEHPMVLRFKNNEFIINVFDQDLANFAERKILFEKKNCDIVNTSYNEKHFLVYYTFIHKGEEFLKVMKINEFGNKTDSTELYKSTSNFDNNSFKNIESEDRSKTILFRSINNAEMDFILFDNIGFKKTYSRRIKFKDIKTKTDFRKIVVSNDGNVFLLFQKTPGIFNKYNNKLIIVNIKDNDHDQKKTVFDVDFYFDNFNIIFDNKNNNLIIAGTRNKLYQNKSEGIFTIKLNSDLNLLFIKSSQFSKNLLENYYKTIKVKSYINNLKIKDIIPRNDGGYLLILEKLEVITRQPTNDFRARYPSYMESTDNVFGEIILISVHENGDEFWSKMITKNQFSSNDDGVYSSFGFLKTSNRINIIFNDEIKDETQVIMYYINPLGRIGRLSLFNTELYDLKLMLQESIQLSNRKMLIPSYNKDKLKLVLLELEND